MSSALYRNEKGPVSMVTVKASSLFVVQIEELTSNLQAAEGLSTSNSSVDSMASSETGSPHVKRKQRLQGNAKRSLLRWVQSMAAKYASYYYAMLCYAVLYCIILCLTIQY